MSQIVGIRYIEILASNKTEYLRWSVSKQDSRYGLGNISTEFLELSEGLPYIQLTRWVDRKTLEVFLARPLSPDYIEKRSGLRKEIDVELYEPITSVEKNWKKSYGEGAINICYIKSIGQSLPNIINYLEGMCSEIPGDQKISLELLRPVDSAQDNCDYLLLVRGENLGRVSDVLNYSSHAFEGAISYFSKFGILSQSTYNIIGGYGR
jgi:hypothetical protein